MEKGVSHLNDESPVKEVSFDKEKLSPTLIKKFIDKVEDWYSIAFDREIGQYDVDMLIALADAFIMYHKKPDEAVLQIDKLFVSLTPKADRPESWPDFEDGALSTTQSNLSKAMYERLNVIQNANVDIRHLSPFAVKELQDKIDPSARFFKESLGESDIEWLIELSKQGYKLDVPSIKELYNALEEAFRLRLQGFTTKDIAATLQMSESKVLQNNRELLKMITTRLATQTPDDLQAFLASEVTKSEEENPEVITDIVTPEESISVSGLAKSFSDKQPVSAEIISEVYNILELVNEAEERDRKAEQYGRVVQNAPTNKEITTALHLLNSHENSSVSNSRDELIDKYRATTLPQGSRAVMMGPIALQEKLDAYGIKIDTALEKTLAWIFNPVYIDILPEAGDLLEDTDVQKETEEIPEVIENDAIEEMPHGDAINDVIIDKNELEAIRYVHEFDTPKERSDFRDNAIGTLFQRYEHHLQVMYLIEEWKKNHLASVNPGRFTNEADFYFKNIGKLKVLTKDEEGFLFGKIENGLSYYQKDVDFNMLALETEQAFIELVAAYQIILHSNIRLVINYARKFRRIEAVEAIDLIQDGMRGLDTGIKRFDTSRDGKLSTYAVWWIRQTVTKSLEKNGRLIRLPEELHQLWPKVLNSKDSFKNKFDREPTILEIAEDLNEDPKKVQTVMIFGDYNVKSLNETVSDESANSMEFGEMIIDRTIDSEREQEKILNRETLLKILDMSNLDNRGKFILGLRFGVSDESMGDLTISTKKGSIEYRLAVQKLGDTGEGATLDEIAELIGLTRERIRQIVNASLKKLKENVEDNDLQVD